MKKIIYRILAYMIDVAIVTLLTIGFMYLPFNKSNNEKVGSIYVNISTNELEYETLTNKLTTYYEDAKFSEDELKDIETDFPAYYNCFKDIKAEEEVTNEIKSDLEKNLKMNYVDIKNDYAYQINKLNVNETIVGFVFYILYFGVLQYFLKGQTLGKKIFKLKVKGINDKKLSIFNYILRSVLVCEILVTGIDLIFLLTMKESLYIDCNYWILQVKYIYEIGFIVVMIIRDDARSVHDLILGTEVVRLEKNSLKDEKNTDKAN